MRRLPFSHLSSIFRSSSLSHGGSSFSPSRLSISPFFSSDARSSMSTLYPSPQSDLTGSVQLNKQVPDISQRDSAVVERDLKSKGAQGPFLGSARWTENRLSGFSQPNAYTERKVESTSFIRGILEEDGRGFMGNTQFSRQPKMEHNADIVHFKLMRNNTFITVTDSKGNTKLKASAGRLEELKGGPKLSRYAAEAIAEYVGRESRKLGMKSVVMKVKGFTYFKKKRQAIMSWKDGFTDSRSDQNPIVHIEDTTRRAHNGCRLPKQRRV